MSDLQALLDEAEIQLAGGDAGDLGAERRWAILSAMGPFDGNPRTTVPAGPGRRRRTLLACLCANYVSPCRQEIPDDDARVNRMLTAARRHAEGEPDISGVNRLIDQVNAMRDVAEDELNISDSAQYAVFTACKAAGVALDDEHPSQWSEEPTGVLEQDVDGLDCAECAAVAFAAWPGAPAGEYAERLRAFWLWYVRQAVPSAMALF